MANGDAAAAAGLATFPASQDLREGYDNDNIRGDELAAVKGDLTAGLATKLDTAKIRVTETPMTAGTPLGTLRFW